MDSLKSFFAWISPFGRGEGETLAEKNSYILKSFVYMGSFLGLLAIVFYAFQAGGFWNWATAFAVAIIFSGGSFLAGSVVGFLFGIPRALQHSSPAAQSPAAGAEGESFASNTNLEQISDWLTKILVGVGLTQLSTMSTKIGQLATVMGNALAMNQGMRTSSAAFSGAVFVYFSIFGFLLCYLWTRLYFKNWLEHPDVAVLSGKVQQAERDTEALALVDKQLDSGFDAKSVGQKELVNAISAASDHTKARIFSRAHSVRARNWQRVETKPLMERTIPIFRALIEVDTEKVFHRNHAELGYALKDQCEPKYDEAEKELSQAIEMRGPWENEGWVIYEFSRAICNIGLDPSFAAGKESTAEWKEKILADLKTAGNSSRLKSVLGATSPIKEWLQMNGGLAVL
jgi:hypothetical protein